jgi:hypothetical protein
MDRMQSEKLTLASYSGELICNCDTTACNYLQVKMVNNMFHGVNIEIKANSQIYWMTWASLQEIPTKQIKKAKE